jgi:hypothetical protein
VINLGELWLAPGATCARDADHAGEVLTYVREGQLTHRCWSGGSSVIQAGEFHLNTVSEGAMRRERNRSKTFRAHVYQLCLRNPMVGIRPAQQERFSAAQRRGLFRLVASSDAREGSLRLEHEALVYSALLEPGQHAVYEIAAGRCVWLHVVSGVVSTSNLLLNAGDGIGVSGQPGVSVTPQEQSELLLVDIRDRTPEGSC